MTQTSLPRSTVTYVAVAVSLLALLVAATSTAFAAGLAANSVGTKQLKKNSVTAKKLKNNAVTATKIKDGSVTAAELADGSVTAAKIASGVVAPRTSTESRDLPISAAPATLTTSGGLTFTFACSALAQDSASVTVVRTGGGTVSYSGTRAFASSSTEVTFPVLDDNVVNLEITNTAPSQDGFAMTTFDGLITPSGLPPVLVQLTAQVIDGEAAPCKLRLAVTPTG